MRYILSLDNSDLSKLLHLSNTTDFIEFITCCLGKEVLVQSFLDANTVTKLIKNGSLQRN